MAVKSLKELQFPGGADSYTFDATLFGGKTPDLFALLGGNNEFTGKNVFSGIMSVTGENGSMTFAEDYLSLQDSDGEPKGFVRFPTSADGGNFYLAWADDESNADLSLYAKTSDLSSYVTNSSLSATLGGYAKLSGSNKFTGSNEFADRIKIGSWLFSDGYVGSLEKGTRVDFGNASGWFAYSSDEEGANLGLYAKTADLNSYVTKTSLSTTLGSYAKLSANNTFTGTNSFSNAISVDTINSKSTGNSIARMYYDTDKAYKVLFGSVARQITLLGSADRPYYAKDGEAFNAHSLALSEDLGDYVKRSEFVPPVGTILAFADGTQPASLYANTTWQKIEGRFIIGADSTYKAGTTGGSSSHRHSLQHPESDGVANIGLQPDGRITTSVSPGWGNSGEGGKSIKISGSSVEPADNWGIDYTATLNGSTAYAETVPPYAAYNLWVRTA